MVDVVPEAMRVVDDSGRPGRSPELNRRLGLALLIIGLLASLVVARTSRAGTIGRAAPEPLPNPPAVGSCLLLQPHLSASVPCTEPHNAEVTHTWVAGVSPPAMPEFHWLAGLPFGDDQAGLCWDDENDYLTSSANYAAKNWITVRPIVYSRLILAPPEQRTAAQGWTACVVVSREFELYTGTVRGGYVGDRTWSSIFGNCVPNRDIPDPNWNCGNGHSIEVFGFLNLDSLLDSNGAYTGAITDADLQSSCVALAVDLTGSADPTFGGKLRVQAASLIPSWTYDVPGYDADGRPITLAVPTSICFVETTGEYVLTSTVIGVGTGPLPLG